jgi:hypothetical protein
MFYLNRVHVMKFLLQTKQLGVQVEQEGNVMRDANIGSFMRPS